MAKAKRRALKVFEAQIGFFDTVVAAPSQAAALRAWGIHQDLFADGRARVTDDPQAVAAAMAYPDMPLKRAVGSADAFGVESANLPTIPNVPKKPTSKPKPTAKPASRRPAAADRSALDAAEEALHRLDAHRKSEEAMFRRRQGELDAEREAAQAAFVADRKAAVAAVAEAHAAYQKAGGEG